MSDPDLQKRLESALAERDAALAELARAREQSNALRLRLANLGEPEPPRYPARAGPGEPPLRYVLVDQVNDGLKFALKPLHGAVRRLLARRSAK